MKTKRDQKVAEDEEQGGGTKKKKNKLNTI